MSIRNVFQPNLLDHKGRKQREALRQFGLLSMRTTG